MSHSVPSWRYAAYGLLGLPLAMSALPVYVQIPVYYTAHLGLALASVGWIMFLARFVDALQDPLLGVVIDRLRGSLHVWFGIAGLMLAGAFYGLWQPLVGKENLALWLGAMLILAYVAHSMLNIAYLAWGARLNDGAGLLGAAAWREAAGLVGVILASVFPSLIVDAGDVGLRWYCLAFGLLLALALCSLLYGAPVWQRSPGQQVPLVQQWKVLSDNRAFRALLVPYFLNAVSVSVPATLVLFFINDRLQEGPLGWSFLATYFLSAAVGLPFWVQLAIKKGALRSWRTGMLVSIVAFISAGFLGTNQVLPFFAICIASGFALGADLALPPVLLAMVIGSEEPPAAYYGIWTLLGKFALAMSGLTLPLLGWLNYHPGQPAGASLSWVYAGIPCALKLVSLICLLRIADPERKS